MIVKTRKVGNATVLTLPTNLKISENIEFEPYVDENGNIIFEKVTELSHEKKEDIKKFMGQFQPLMDKLKDM